MTSTRTAKRRQITNILLFFCGLLLIAVKLLTAVWPAAEVLPEAEPTPGAVGEGMMTMTLNPDPEFETGAAAGNVLLGNAAGNGHPLTVVFTLRDTGEEVYSSGTLRVGEYRDEDRLSVILSAGEYPCVATFTYIDETTAAPLGYATYGITLHVLH